MENLNDFKVGDVILVHKKPPYKIEDLPAPIIRYLTKCYYNHSAIIGECLGDLYVFEAVGKGFVPTKRLDQYFTEVGTRRDILIIRPNGKAMISKEEFYTRIELLVNKGYDFKSLLWYQLWYRITGRWTGATTEENALKSVYCSEAIAYIYKHIFPFWYKTAPCDIYNNIDGNFDIIFKNN